MWTRTKALHTEKFRKTLLKRTGSPACAAPSSSGFFTIRRPACTRKCLQYQQVTHVARPLLFLSDKRNAAVCLDRSLELKAPDSTEEVVSAPG
jgi:hypothetical protein